MPEHFADRLLAAMVRKDAPVCVGLDPLPDRMPVDLKEQLENKRPATAEGRRAFADVLLEFGTGVIEAVAELVPAVKLNIAFFEPFRADGLRAYEELVRRAHAAGLLVIGDIKRSDIGHSAAQYARAHLGDAASADRDDAGFFADAVTVNPYFGVDGVGPFIEAARVHGRGLFVLVQTSNESAGQIQGLQTRPGETVVNEVARLVREWARRPELMGRRGFSAVGAVVSPRDLESTRSLRTLMPESLFLVPGFGAQGRTAAEVATCFNRDGLGAIVNASRSVIHAFDQARDPLRGKWKESISQACRAFVADVRSALPR